MTIDEKIKQAAEEYIANPFKQLHFISGGTYCKSLMLADMQKLVEALEWRFRSKHFPSIGTNDEAAAIANMCLDEVYKDTLDGFNAKYKVQK